MQVQLEVSESYYFHSCAAKEADPKTWVLVDRIRVAGVSTYYVAQREAIITCQLAAAQHHLFWNTAKEMGMLGIERGGHHSPRSLPLHRA